MASRKPFVGGENYRSNTTAKSGVYVVNRNEEKEQECDRKQDLETTRAICLHNASVCSSIGELEKENVWTMLAETIDNLANTKMQHGCDGWGGSSGGALGVELV